MPTSRSVLLTVAVVFAAFLILVVVGYWLHRTILALSTDRMSIARQLDRIHQIFGAFKYGMYCEETSLLTPMYYGWGFEPKFDASHQHARAYAMMLWILCLIDWIILTLKQLGPIFI
jgi:hypothetical protein